MNLKNATVVAINIIYKDDCFTNTEIARNAKITTNTLKKVAFEGKNTSVDIVSRLCDAFMLTIKEK